MCYTVRLSRLFRYCLRPDGAQGRALFPPISLSMLLLLLLLVLRKRGERCPEKKNTHTVGPFRCAVSRAQCHEKNDNFNSFSSSSFYRGQFSLFTPTALLLLSSLCCLRGEIGFLFLPASCVPCVVQVPSVSCLILLAYVGSFAFALVYSPIYSLRVHKHVHDTRALFSFSYTINFWKKKKAI